MSIKFKRIASAVLAGAILLTNFTACSQSVPVKSNPVAVDEYGDVDMEVALKYETDVDALVAELESREPDPAKPVSQHMNKKTLEVFNYLREIYGTKTLVAQQMWNSKGYEDDVYYKGNKDLPAIKGFDMIFSNLEDADNSQVDEAIKWHTRSGGLVTFTWHWNVPRNIGNSSKGFAFYSEEIEDFSLENAVTPGTQEYEVIIKDIDTIAIQLQRLEAADVPVLWRPLHEASGKWFWWGGYDREVPLNEYYKKLWYIIFDRLENYHKLTNLIWIWNGQDKHHTVNANTYDIAGTDIYAAENNHKSQVSEFNKLKELTWEGKMIALTECGNLPAVEEMEKDGIMWLYSMLWYGDFTFAPAGSSNSPELDNDGLASVNTKRMSEEFISDYLKSDKVVTWNKLPEYEGTERNIPEAMDLRFKLAEWSASH